MAFEWFDIRKRIQKLPKTYPNFSVNPSKTKEIFRIPCKSICLQYDHPLASLTSLSTRLLFLFLALPGSLCPPWVPLPSLGPPCFLIRLPSLGLPRVLSPPSVI